MVGLPDEAGGETVACLCVPEYGERRREEVRAEVEEHFRRVSAELPFYRRIKVLRLWDGELPRTSTRKVKRKLVVEELRRLEKLAATGERVRPAAQTGSADWLLRLVAEVIGKPAAEVQPGSRLAADLGFDSLMLTELSVALEAAGVPLPEGGDISGVETVADLAAGARLGRPALPGPGGAGGVAADRGHGRDAGDCRSRRRWPAWAARWSTSGRRPSSAGCSR